MLTKMERLATFFVSAVLFANTYVPQANLPKVLGVNVVRAADATDSAQMADESGTLTHVRAEREAYLEQARARREAALERAATRRSEFQTRLNQIRDTRKRQTVEQINEKLAKINATKVERFDAYLTRLSEILAKATTRTDKAQAKGYDVTAVRSAITDAQVAIDAAQAAVDVQATKVYEVEVTDEQTLGQAARAAITQLKSDLSAVRETVKTAKEAVQAVLVALGQLRGIDDIN